MSMPAGSRSDAPPAPRSAADVETLLQRPGPSASDVATRKLGPASQPQPAAPARATRPGDVPDQLGSYRVLKKLGRGGMGAVYLAEDTQLRRQTALKVMLPDVAADLTARERFLREAQAAAAVRNDHVVTVYQVGEQGGVPFIAMELLRGASLAAYLDQQPAPGIAAILRLGREIATGLAAAHDRGLVHRDIKPANIWLEAPKGRVKILDFGLARPAQAAPEDSDKLTQVGAVVGTPAYMSLEQARGQPVDFRTDLYSLGVVLYRLCTGRLPFVGPTSTAVLTELALTDPPPVGELNPRVPPALSALIDRLMQKDPANRPQSAHEVAEAIREIEADPDAATLPDGMLGFEVVEDDEPTEVAPPPARSATRTRRRGRPRRRPRADWLVGAGVALALAGMAVGIPAALYYAIRSRPVVQTKSAEARQENAPTEPKPAATAGESHTADARPAPVSVVPMPTPDRPPPPPPPPPGEGPPPRFPGGPPPPGFPPPGGPGGPRPGF